MKKFLVVGVGGSGGATLRYLMDQLRADLRERGVERLPDAWQFVHVDVNPVPESTEGLGDIVKLGGRYVPVGMAGRSFDDVRRIVETRLEAKGGLASLATWVPGRAADSVPVGTGAGQFRAIGRMLTLTQVGEIESALNRAWQALQSPTAWGELSLAFPEQEQDGTGSVVPIVVGSLAGGSGASMFLDVCRIMGRIHGMDRAHLGAFLFTPDVFQSLSFDKRMGIDGNAMAALGELIAAQAGASADADGDILEALGLPSDRAKLPPFGRAFPIGSFIGGDGARFGETHEDVYRGLARALAATMRSGVATEEYLKTHIENPGPGVKATGFGWGVESDLIGWSSLGYASLSLGRDRYAEYVAQRLARAAVDQLVEGFFDPTSQLLPTEQLDQLINNQWDNVIERIGLARQGESAGRWLTNRAVKDVERREMVLSATSPFVSWAERLDSMPAGTWLAEVRSGAHRHEPAAVELLDAQVYQWVENYASVLEERTKSEVVRLLAHPRQGLPYARRLLERLQGDVATLTEGLRRAPGDLVALKISEETAAEVAELKNTATANDRLVQTLARGVRAGADRRLRSVAARLLADVLTSYSSDVLGALHRAVSQALEALEHARGSTEQHAGIALLRTTIYNEWPQNADAVPQRFDHAVNEVLLTSSTEFPARFKEHVAAQRPDGAFQDNLADMVEDVVGGSWESTGAARSQFEVIVTERSWRAPALTVDKDRQPTPPSKPVYTLAMSTAELLDRALAYQARKGYPFEKFSSQSFEDYLHEPGVSDVELARRRDTFVERFGETIKQARPLVGVSQTMIDSIHKAHSRAVDLTFGDIPLQPGTVVVQRVRQMLDDETAERYDRALKPAAPVSRIAMFSSYPKYSPLVYASFLRQLKGRWDAENDHGQTELWKHKRARPLPAALAMGSDELSALIAGWYIGRALGLVRQPEKIRSDEPVGVWDAETNAWSQFQGRLLTPRQHYRDAAYDWLPGVLEGHTLALVNSVDDPDLKNLAPYVVLRRIADDREGSTDGAAPSAGMLRLEEWIATGEWRSGVPSQIKVLTEAGPDAESRADALITWLGDVRGWIETNWLERTSSYDRNAPHRLRVESRTALHALPLFAEIALPTYEVLGELILMAEVAKSKLLTGGSGGAAPQV